MTAAFAPLMRLQTSFAFLNNPLFRFEKTVEYKRALGVVIPNISCKTSSFSYEFRFRNQHYEGRENHRCFPPVHAVLSEEVGVSSSQFKDFSVSSMSTNETGVLKVSVEVSGAGSRAIFDDVFEKMVEAAQPIPGFRRVKGGKTPDIPRDILLEVLGPSKVYMQVIKKVINSTIAEYVEKGGLKVSKDLRVEQSFEDLEDAFEPDEKFCFDVVLKLL